MEEEQWRRIPDFLMYEASSLGRVRRIQTGYVLKQHVNGGYPRIGLYRDGKLVHKFIHCLVAKAFLPNFYGHPSVDHRDRNPENNALFNLRWADHAMQAQNRTKATTTSLARTVIQTNFETGAVAEWRSATLADKELDFPRGSVSQLCRNGNIYNGSTWMFKDQPLQDGEEFRQAFTDETRVTPIPGIFVSNHGRVKLKNGRITSGCLCLSGYLKAHCGGRENYVHRITAFAWLVHVPGTDRVNHIDSDKQNNHTINLEWATAVDNARHAAANNGNAREVEQYDLNGILVGTFTCTSAASQHTGIASSRIDNNLRYNSRRCNGFIFKYKTDETDINVRIESLKTYNRRVSHYDLNWLHLRVFDSVTEAARVIGIDRCTIRSHINKGSKRPCMKRCYFRYHVEE